MKTRYIHDMIEFKDFGYRRRTVGIKYDHTIDSFRIAQAICHEKDNYCRKTGRQVVDTNLYLGGEHAVIPRRMFSFKSLSGLMGTSYGIKFFEGRAMETYNGAENSPLYHLYKVVSRDVK
jgi:hypothetical protein